MKAKEEVKKVNFLRHFVVKVHTNSDKPYELEGAMPVEIMTNKRVITFNIQNGYRWNGADIPRFFWRLIGAPSETDFLKASMLHDWLLQFKVYAINEIFANTLTIDEYRLLTSEAFREVLIDEGVNKFKAKVMADAVQFYQKYCNKKGWRV